MMIRARGEGAGGLGTAGVFSGSSILCNSLKGRRSNVGRAHGRSVQNDYHVRNNSDADQGRLFTEGTRRGDAMQYWLVLVLLSSTTTYGKRCKGRGRRASVTSHAAAKTEGERSGLQGSHCGCLEPIPGLPTCYGTEDLFAVVAIPHWQQQRGK